MLPFAIRISMVIAKQKFDWGYCLCCRPHCPCYCRKGNLAPSCSHRHRQKFHQSGLLKNCSTFVQGCKWSPLGKEGLANAAGSLLDNAS